MLVFDSIEQVGVLTFIILSTLSNQVQKMRHAKNTAEINSLLVESSKWNIGVPRTYSTSSCYWGGGSKAKKKM